MRRQAEDGALNPGSIRNARQQISVGGQLLAHLEDLDVPFGKVRQAHLDAWLAEGPSTRYQAYSFVIWATKTKHLPPLIFPHRKARQSPVMTQQERLSLLSRFLRPEPDEPLPVAYRLAAVLLLLYAQPMTRIVRLKLEDIVTTPDGPAIRLGVDPAVLPPAVADLVAQHRGNRPNINTAANTDSPWLFPGHVPGQPLHPSYFMGRVRDAGVHLLGGRNSALRQLVLDMPPAVAAQAIGYSPQVAEQHARQSGATWVTYASYRAELGRGAT